MSRRIICTVGTSLLTNADRPWSWRPGQSLPELAKVIEWLKTAEADKASAETNTLLRIELEAKDMLVFLHSHTDEGVFCAKALQQHYEGRGFAASAERIAQLGYGADNFTQGLKGLVDAVLRHVRKSREIGQQPVFAATGGFKAEIAFLNVLGALLQIEVVYLHELHRQLVRLPRLPLSWDQNVVQQHEEFFRWIDEKPRRSEEVESWLKGRPELRFVVEDDNDGHTMISAAGDLLFKAAKERHSMGPRAEWPTADPKPPNHKNKVSKVSNVSHHRPKGWEQFVNRLCCIDCVSLVRVETKNHSAQRQRVSVVDADKGTFAVRFGLPGNELLLAVETTATGAAQCDLVKAYFEKLR